MLKKDGIKIESHRGTWYVIDETEVAGHSLFLLEHEQYGEDAPALIVDFDGTIIAEDVENGFEDLPNRFEIEVKIKGKLPAVSFPGSYPIVYHGTIGELLCADCATDNASHLQGHECHMEGVPVECFGCNAKIESAYGDPEEDEEPHFNEDLDVLRRIEASMVNPYPHEDYEDDVYSDPDICSTCGQLYEDGCECEEVDEG